MSKIKSTYKSKDTEETLDKLFYRPIGYVIALAAKALYLTPNAVTIISIFFGVFAGHLFYYNNLTINIYGMLMLMLAQALDGADGQLARMTNTKSQVGRILDGLAGNLWFISIYLHLVARHTADGGSPWILAVAVIAGISHSLQSAAADYFRNYYVLYVLDKSKSEIDDSIELQKINTELSWKKDFIKKFLMRFYINYTVEQEFMAYNVKKLYQVTKNKFGSNFPKWFSEKYRELHKPLIKWYNILTTNTRMIILFIALFIGRPNYYWFFELTVLNVLLVYVLVKHFSYSKLLLNKINTAEV